MEKKSTRVAYGEMLERCGSDSRIVVLDADLSSCTMTVGFARKWPDRFFNCGIAEANMIGVAAGLAACGNIVFANSFAMFMAGRCFEQIRNSVAYPCLNVKLIGTHAGLSVGEDGATHQCLEDVAAMRAIPNMTILNPCDANETRECVKAAIEHDGPVYLRLGRPAVDNVTESRTGYSFRLGKGIVLMDGEDAAIIATGIMVHEAVRAAEQLRGEGICVQVIDMPTIKPLDEALVLEAAQTGLIVTAEEHNLYGGLGEAVARVLTACAPTAQECVAVKDVFGHSGKVDMLMERYGLTARSIVEAVKRGLKRR